MVIGCLGDVVFKVSSREVETITNAQWSGSARYAAHQRHLDNALTEFTGNDPDKFSFDIYLSEYLNIKVMPELVKLWGYMRTGKAVELVLGEKGYGKYRWNITSLIIKMQRFDTRGNLTEATVSVSLQEYIGW